MRSNFGFRLLWTVVKRHMIICLRSSKEIAFAMQPLPSVRGESVRARPTLWWRNYYFIVVGVKTKHQTVLFGDPFFGCLK